MAALHPKLIAPTLPVILSRAKDPRERTDIRHPPGSFAWLRMMGASARTGTPFSFLNLTSYFAFSACALSAANPCANWSPIILSMFMNMQTTFEM